MTTGAKIAMTLLLLSGCVDSPYPHETVTTPAPPLPVFAALPAEGPYAWHDDWNFAIARTIVDHAPELLDNGKVPADEIRSLCPGFFTATSGQKQAFWALFLASVSRYESTFNPKARLVEDWKDPETGRRQISQGLLQLSYSDRLNHPDCHLDPKTRNINDPEANLQCGVVILRKQLEVKKTLFPKPRPYYWAVLSNKSKRDKVRGYFKAHLHDLGFCQAQPALTSVVAER